MKKVTKSLTLALCQGRHEMPAEVAGSIFEGVVNPLDPQGLEEKASAVVAGAETVTIFVTGLSVALVAALNACKKAGVKNVVLMHYNRDAGNYYPQKVLL